MAFGRRIAGCAGVQTGTNGEHDLRTRAAGATRPLVMFVGLRGIGHVQGGIETHVTHLVRHLPLPVRDMEVVGRTPYRVIEAHDPTLPAVRWLPTVRRQSVETVIHTLASVAYAAVRRPALLHIHGIGPNFVTPLARLLGLKVVATHHGADYNREKWDSLARRLLRWGEKQAVMRANACIAISPIDAEALRRRYGRDVAYIPNGVGTLPPAPPGATLAEHGLVPGRYIVNVARLVPEKRQLDLVEAFARADLPTDVRLLLIGGADHESAYVHRLRERAAEVPGIVMPGHVNGTPLAELFSNAGLFVLPSAHEGLPFALLEAMSYGRRLLLSNLPVYRAMGIPEACLFPVGDTRALTARLAAAFTEPTASVDWSVILADYRWAHVAERTAAVYARVLDGH